MSKELCFYSWFSGFVDGEGSFLIVRKQLKNGKCGYVYLPVFTITLRRDDMNMLINIQKKLKLGSCIFTSKNKRFKNAYPGFRWSVSGIKQCLELIHLFNRCPLQTKKNVDYKVWRSFVLQKAEFRNKMPKSMCEYFFYRIKEAREYNKIAVEAYEIDSGLRITLKREV